MLKKICNKQNCNRLIKYTEKYCDKHQVVDKQSKYDRNKDYDKHIRDKRASAFYRNKQWIALRELVKQEANGLCVSCLDDKRLVAGYICDHIVPISVDWSMRLIKSNLQYLCVSCHNSKTAEDKKKYSYNS